MTNPSVSVIIPNYCHAQFLDQRIQTVLDQTYRNFEVIILDDCSQDDGASRAVIEKFRDNPHVSQIVYNETNSGSPFIQWKRGFQLAKGELLWIAESDDYCEPDFLKTLVAEFENDENCALAFCRSLHVNEQGVPLQSPDFGETDVERMDGIGFIKKYMTVDNTVENASAVLFKKDFALAADPSYTGFKSAGDQLFWIFICEQGNVAYNHSHLNMFRQHGSNKTSKMIADGTTSDEVLKIYKYCCRKRYVTSLKKKFFSRKTYMDWVDSNVNDAKVKRKIGRIWDPLGTVALYNFLQLDKWTVTSWLLKGEIIRALFLHRRPLYDKKYKISICGIFRDEAPFLKEWIEFNNMVGVDHFYLYNNNSSDNYAAVLQPYIDAGLVTLVEFPYDHAQCKAYQHFYETYRNETQWVSFLDMDEFFCPNSALNLHDWIKPYETYPVIQIYWKWFGTSGLVEHDYNKLVIEQYHVCIKGLHDYGKCLVNTDYDIISFDAGVIHCPGVSMKILGKDRIIHPVNIFHRWTVRHGTYLKTDESNPTIQINHYSTKSWSEYNRKRMRPDAVFKVNPRDITEFLRRENKNDSVDYNIYKYLMQLKLRLMGIN